VNKIINSRLHLPKLSVEIFKIKVAPCYGSLQCIQGAPEK